LKLKLLVASPDALAWLPIGVASHALAAAAELEADAASDRLAIPAARRPRRSAHQVRVSR